MKDAGIPADLDRRKQISIQSKMLSIIFHDIAPILVYISDSARRLKEQPRPGEAVLKEELENISYTTDELISNIRTFLDWGDFLQPSFEPAPTYQSLFLLVESVTRVYQGEAKKKGLGIFNQTDKELLMKIDPVLLRIILSNLLSNSLKHTDYGAIHIRSAVKSSRIIISVEDSGHGMTEDRVKALWDALQIKGRRVNWQEAYQPKGLGYQIIADLMNMASGEISIQSTPGSGTVVHLCFKEE
jgi:two-component system, NarL family, sensor histidine kinase EvgS